MPITQYLERNAREYGDDVALVEINPDVQETRRVTWREYELIESNPTCCYRREITWSVFNEKANRFANLLVARGIQKGDEVGILMMNSLECFRYTSVYLRQEHWQCRLTSDMTQRR